MSKPHQRVFAFIAAMLFLATAVASGVVVIWQIKKDNEASKSPQDSTSIQSQSSDAQQQNNQQEANKLEGTKLANFTPVAKIDTLQSQDIKEGTGDLVKPGATVTAHYTGAVAATGVIFQSSKDGGQPVTFPLSNVIAGWQEGVPGMKVGGTRRLLIPAAKAYGANPPSGSGIPANADLVFDIELTSVQQ